MYPANRKFSSILDKLCSRNCAVCASCRWGSVKDWALPWRKNRPSITQGYVCSFLQCPPPTPTPLSLSYTHTQSSKSVYVMVSIGCKHLLMISIRHQMSTDIDIRCPQIYYWNNLEREMKMWLSFLPRERTELWLWWSHLCSGTECIWTVADASYGSVRADSSQAHTYLTHSSLVCSPRAVWFGLCVFSS